MIASAYLTFEENFKKIGPFVIMLFSLSFQDLAGGEMMIGYIEILSDCVSLSDSQRTALSKRFFDFNMISYCGMTR